MFQFSAEKDNFDFLKKIAKKKRKKEIIGLKQKQWTLLLNSAYSNQSKNQILV